MKIPPIILPAAEPLCEAPHHEFPTWCAGKLREAINLAPPGTAPATLETEMLLQKAGIR